MNKQHLARVTEIEEFVLQGDDVHEQAPELVLELVNMIKSSAGAGITEHEGATLSAEVSAFGAGFHTAFRKALDNRASAVMWNAIELLPEKEWELFCQRVVVGDGSLKTRCLVAAEYMYGEPVMNIFSSALDMLEDEDWNVVNTKLIEYAGIVLR
jgi:hypothetical protein